MQVYKFGGASVKDADAVNNVIAILADIAFNEKVVVVSAMDKTTNELEQVVREYYAGNSNWQPLLDRIITKHHGIAEQLLGVNPPALLQAIDAIHSTVQNFLKQNTSRNFNFVYDQVVSAGEFLSTAIISAYANSRGLKNTLLNVKEVLFTDHAYTEAKVDFAKSSPAIANRISELVKDGFVVTQGFIGSTPDGFTTTLGREGSDYTASVFSFALNAERMTVWKDVDGILNADPKEFPDAQLLPEITYHEAIEMTYYGASVIHPKTIKPIQNKNIPLEVRSFKNFNRRGTVISANANTGFMPPVIIRKRNQILLSFSAKDFSFIAEEHLSRLFAVIAANRLRVNMMQNAAISFSVCVDYQAEKIENVITSLESDFGITRNESLTLLTIRHYHEGIVAKLTNGKDVLLRQLSRHTIQVLMRD